MNRGRRGLLGCLLSLAGAVGCGGSAGGDPAATLASCNAYCDAYIAAACPSPNYTTVDECKTTECASHASATSQCQGLLKTYYDCEKTQADICEDTGCTNQLAAAVNCQ